MPKKFLECTKKKGSRTRTKKLSGGRHIKVCFHGGESVAGEVKKNKRKKKGS